MRDVVSFFSKISCLCNFLIFPLFIHSQVYSDSTFNSKICVPAFSENKPVIYIDEAHRNLHKMNTGFKGLSKLLREDGFVVKSNTEKFSDEWKLNDCHILIIANALHPSNVGNWIEPIQSAFSEDEISVLQKWVKNGGVILLIADHMPFGKSIKKLASTFGIEYLNGFVGIDDTKWPPNVFSRKNRTLHTNKSIHAYYQIDSVATFTGTALKFPSLQNSILNFTVSDTIYYTDTAWIFNHNTPKQSLEGYSQGGIIGYGKGLIAAFGEAAMFTSQIIAADHTKVGFNSEAAPQNVKFIRNLFYNLLRDPQKYDASFYKNVNANIYCK